MPPEAARGRIGAHEATGCRQRAHSGQIRAQGRTGGALRRQGAHRGRITGVGGAYGRRAPTRPPGAPIRAQEAAGGRLEGNPCLPDVAGCGGYRDFAITAASSYKRAGRGRRGSGGAEREGAVPGTVRPSRGGGSAHGRLRANRCPVGRRRPGARSPYGDPGSPPSERESSGALRPSPHALGERLLANLSLEPAVRKDAA